MQLDPQEWLQISLLSGRPLEPQTEALIVALLDQGDVFVDAGAHVGWLSLLAARSVGPKGRVIAVDPQPYNCDRIPINAMINELENFLVASVALSDRDDWIQCAHQRGQDKARFKLEGQGVNDTPYRFLCASLTLDTLLTHVGVDGQVKLLKIDVEGHELQVLQGASAALARVEHIIFEALPSTDTDAHEGAARLLEAAGFAPATVDGSPWRAGDSAPENNVWACRVTDR